VSVRLVTAGGRAHSSWYRPDSTPTEWVRSPPPMRAVLSTSAFSSLSASTVRRRWSRGGTRCRIARRAGLYSIHIARW